LGDVLPSTSPPPQLFPWTVIFFTPPLIGRMLFEVGVQPALANRSPISTSPLPPFALGPPGGNRLTAVWVPAVFRLVLLGPFFFLHTPIRTFWSKSFPPPKTFVSSFHPPPSLARHSFLAHLSPVLFCFVFCLRPRPLGWFPHDTIFQGSTPSCVEHTPSSPGSRRFLYTFLALLPPPPFIFVRTYPVLLPCLPVSKLLLAPIGLVSLPSCFFFFLTPCGLFWLSSMIADTFFFFHKLAPVLTHHHPSFGLRWQYSAVVFSVFFPPRPSVRPG